MIEKAALDAAKARFGTREHINGHSRAFDVQAYCEHYGRKLTGTKQLDESILYCLEQCPFDSSHGPNQAAIGITSAGIIFFQCFHESCKGKTWNDARTIISGKDPLTAFMSKPRLSESLNPGHAKDDSQTTKTDQQTCFLRPSYFYDRDNSYEPQYLVEELFLSKSLILLAGSPGSMKSWLMQTLLVESAAELKFLGRLTKKAKFFYFDRENPEDIWQQRLVQYCPTRVSDEFVHIWPFWVHPPPPKFLEPYYVELAKGNPGSVFIFDSYSKFLPKGYSENVNENAADVTNFLRELTSHGITIILIHHAGKDSTNGIRGAEEILAGVDVAYTVSKNENRLTLKSVKNRFALVDTITVDVKTDANGYLFFENASEEENSKKEQVLKGQIEVTREIIAGLNAKGAVPTKEAVKSGLKKKLGVGDHTTRKIIDQGITRRYLSYDTSAKVLSVVVGLSPPKEGVTTPTTTPQISLLSEQQSTNDCGIGGLTERQYSTNPLVISPNRQESTAPTTCDDEDFIPEIHEGSIPDSEDEQWNF